MGIWIALVVSNVVLVLTILAVMRETMILRGSVAALSSLITIPPDPTFIGGALPSDLHSAVSERLQSVRGNGMKPVVLGFLGRSCTTCEHLITELSGTSSDLLEQAQFVLVIRGSSTHDRLYRLAAQTSASIVLDPRGHLFDLAQVRSTPGCFVLSHELKVREYKLRPDASWIRAAIPRAHDMSVEVSG